MTEPTFGISFLRDDNEPRPAIESDLSVVGLIGPMADANESIPLNDPITFDSDDTALLAALGANNLIHDAINGVNAQLAQFQKAARIVLVRVAASQAGTDAEKERENIASIAGDSAAGTGMHAFLKAGQKLGVIPRLIAAPGFTHQQPSVLTTITLTDGGEDYTSAPSVTITPANGAGERTSKAFTESLTQGLAGIEWPKTAIPDQSSEAAAAGAQTAQSFGYKLLAELRRVEAEVRASVSRMVQALSFSASPSITPKIAPAPPAGGATPMRGTAPATTPSPSRTAARGLYADYDNGGDLDWV